MADILFNPETRIARPHEFLSLYRPYEDIAAKIMDGRYDVTKVPDLSLESKRMLDPRCSTAEGIALTAQDAGQVALALPCEWLVSRLERHIVTPEGQHYAQETLGTISCITMIWNGAFQLPEELIKEEGLEPGVYNPATLRLELTGRTMHATEIAISARGDHDGWLDGRLSCYEDCREAPQVLVDERKSLEYTQIVDGEDFLTYNEYRVGSFIAMTLRDALEESDATRQLQSR